LLGWAAVDSASLEDGNVTFSILQAFVPNDGDGLSRVLERLERASIPAKSDLAAFEEAMTWLGIPLPGVLAVLDNLARRLGRPRR
jgi:predicted trehalose synthase